VSAHAARGARRHIPANYHPKKAQPLDPKALFVTLAPGAAATTVEKVDPVNPALVKKTKELGRGGQGVAYRATYPGVAREIAAKFLLPGASATPQARTPPPRAPGGRHARPLSSVRRARCPR